MIAPLAIPPGPEKVHIGGSRPKEQAVVSKRIRDQALLSTNGRYVEVEDAGHQIHRDQPDQVLEAIREVVEAARR